jgi:hypothetical protein
VFSRHGRDCCLSGGNGQTHFAAAAKTARMIRGGMWNRLRILTTN